MNAGSDLSKSPDLPELDFFDVLLKEAGGALGLKVFTLDLLLTTGMEARRFAIPSTPQTILPNFNQANVETATHHRGIAMTAMKKRKAEEDARIRKEDARAKRPRKPVQQTGMRLQDILDSIT